MASEEKASKHALSGKEVTGSSDKKIKKTENQTRPVVFKTDPCYRFQEVPLEKTEAPLNFSPSYFLRTHSKNNDPADVQTQIWQCVFEPHPDNVVNMTNVVATCGGSSVCFVNVKTGEIEHKYNRTTKTKATDNLYAVAWSTISLDELGLKKINIMAAGGGRSTVLLMHPDEGVCYQMFRTVPNKIAAVVNSLIFHPKKSTWLFCGHEDGHIQLWDVDIPTIPEFNTNPVHLMTIPAFAGDVFNLVISQTNDMLIAGCDQGLYAWSLDFDKLENNERLDETEFKIPQKKNSGTVVDSITLVRDDIIAVKCALHGSIYVFSLSNTLKHAVYNSKSSRKEVTLQKDWLIELNWSDTDNFYMNMGVDPKSCVLVCGDDKGTLWVYDIYDYVSGTIPNPLTQGPSLKSVLQPSCKLAWPELDDAEVEKARKLRLDTYDIVVDNCTVSHGGRHIVAVTSNNMVCIWKRGNGPHDESEDKLFES